VDGFVPKIVVVWDYYMFGLKFTRKRLDPSGSYFTNDQRLNE